MHYGKNILSKLVQTAKESVIDFAYGKMYSSLFMAIDALDNGISMYKTKEQPLYTINTDLGSRVRDLNPQWNDEIQNYDAGFMKALALCDNELLEHLHYNSKVLYPARELVEEGYKSRVKFHPSGKMMYLKTGCPWKDHLYSIEEKDSQLLYVIFPNNTGAQYQIGAVPISQGGFENRKPLLKAWRGKKDEELQKVSGFVDAVFVHATGFMGIFGSLASAVKAAEICINSE